MKKEIKKVDGLKLSVKELEEAMKKSHKTWKNLKG